MANPGRVFANDLHYHVILRCNNKEHRLQQDEDFALFLTLLEEQIKKHHVKIYNFVLMNSHAHLMLSTHNDLYLNIVMHNFCLRYAKAYNSRYQRTGHLWRSRYRARLILSDAHALACLRYQHLNPVEAGIASEPGHWPWSGYQYYAWGISNTLLTPHPAYLGLAKEAVLRTGIYRRFVLPPLTEEEKREFARRRTRYSPAFQHWATRNTTRLLQEVAASLEVTTPSEVPVTSGRRHIARKGLGVEGSSWEVAGTSGE